MRTRLASLLPSVGLILALLAGQLAVAADSPVNEARESTGDGISTLLGAFGGLPMPNLSGLIQPEKMGMLTDNQCEIRDNQAHLLSDNETDVTALSGNKVSILSGLRLFSGFTINVHVTIDERDGKASKSKKGDGRRKSRKSKSKRKKPRAKQKDRA